MLILGIIICVVLMLSLMAAPRQDARPREPFPKIGGDDDT